MVEMQSARLKRAGVARHLLEARDFSRVRLHAGKYIKNTTVMIVSRGIGNSIIPVRLNNRPEIVIVELVQEQ